MADREFIIFSNPHDEYARTFGIEHGDVVFLDSADFARPGDIVIHTGGGHHHFATLNDDEDLDLVGIVRGCLKDYGGDNFTPLAEAVAETLKHPLTPVELAQTVRKGLADIYNDLGSQDQERIDDLENDFGGGSVPFIHSLLVANSKRKAVDSDG
jgi:hypothetical protein